MLVRERIDPHFSAARKTPLQDDEPRADGATVMSRCRGWGAAALLPFGPRRLLGLVGWSRRDAFAALVGSGAAAAIAANGLMLQSGPHPAPIFAIRPSPAVAREATGAVALLPRPRPAETAKPEPAHLAERVPLPPPRPRPQAPATPQGAAGRADPIADLINPARQISAVQRVLNDFGYGPIRVSGTVDENTKAGIERFERDHNLPVTGQNSPRLRQALGVTTGRSLE